MVTSIRGLLQWQWQWQQRITSLLEVPVAGGGGGYPPLAVDVTRVGGVDSPTLIPPEVGVGGGGDLVEEVSPL
jgi:hypothetical protein